MKPEARHTHPQNERIVTPADATAGTLARPVLVVGDDMTAAELAVFLLHRQRTAAAVTSDGKVIGFVSMTDLVREHVIEGDTYDSPDSIDEVGRARKRRRTSSGFHFESPSTTRVRDIMMPFLLALQERSTAAQTAAVMAAHGVHRLLVVAENGEAVGVVHAVDLLRHFARCAGVYVPDEPSRKWRRECENAL